jgi:hypothetical protein
VDCTPWGQRLITYRMIIINIPTGPKKEIILKTVKMKGNYVILNTSIWRKAYLQYQSVPHMQKLCIKLRNVAYAVLRAVT